VTRMREQNLDTSDIVQLMRRASAGYWRAWERFSCLAEGVLRQGCS
jgi:hypothetical protein